MLLDDEEDDDGGFWREKEGKGGDQPRNKTERRRAGGPSLRPRLRSFVRLERRIGINCLEKKEREQEEDFPLFTDLRCDQERSRALYPRFKHIQYISVIWPSVTRPNRL